MPATDRQGHELQARLAPLIAELGVELEDIRVTRVGRRTLVKIVIDRDGGLELDDLADVSRAVDADLDGNDPFAGPFVLEVSSPGVDRPLTEPRHWRRNAGRLVQVEHAGHPLTARIVSADGAGVVLDPGASSTGSRTSDTQDPAPGHLVAAYDQLGPGRVQVEFNRQRVERPVTADDTGQGS